MSAGTPGYPIVGRYSDTEVNGNKGGSWVAAQAADGTLLFGSLHLLSFDGERWRSAPMANSYAVRGLDLAPNGRLWAGGIGEIGWYESDAGIWKFHSLRPQLPPEAAEVGVLWHVFADGDGAIFVTDEQILRWDGHSFRVWTMRGDAALGGSIRLRGFRVGRDVYIQHKPTGLHVMRSAGPQLVFPADTIGTAGLFLVEHSSDEWTFVSALGIFKHKAGRLSAVPGTANAYLRDHPLTAVTRLPDGRVAFGTTNDGVALVSPQWDVTERVNQDSGLSESYIASLFVDRQGSLWATSRTAIFRIPLTETSTQFDARAQLPPQQTLRITKAGDRIVVLTDDSLYWLASNQRTFIRQPLPGGPFSDMLPQGDGVLAGGYGSLLHAVPGEISPTGISFQDINFVSQLGGRRIIGDRRDLHELLPSGALQPLLRDMSEHLTSVVEDPAGTIWAGTMSSGVQFKTRDADRLESPPSGTTGLRGTRGTAVVSLAPDGALFAFDRDGGWIRPAGAGRFQPIQDFPAREIAAFARDYDSAGDLWVVLRGGEDSSATVGRVTRGSGRAFWQPHSVEGLQQIGSARCIFVESTTGQPTILWIGGTTGVVVRNVVTHGPVAAVPPAPLLRAFAQSAEGDEPRLIGARLPYSTRSIQFEFAQPDFARRPMLRLETRIDGLDRDWLPAGPDSRRELTGVRDGRYTFNVRAVAETGVASAPTAFAFEVAPPWWRTIPAILGVAFALLPFGYGMYRLRLRALRRRNVALEAKVRERTEQFEKASAAKTQFVANMSHDIRNPLNGIVGLALALEDSRLDPKQREIVATLRECTTYLSSLVDDVLDFASIEAGRVELRPGPFVPAQLLRSIATALKADTTESGAALQLDIDPALPAHLSGDAGRIQQILVNYVSNALKYAGGAIHLSAKIPPGSPDEVEFSVSDQGPGISTADQATLFTKFTRLSAARTHDIPGAGLGLASCRLLADIMGGSVGVSSQPGEGARFYLRLPLTAAVAGDAPETGDLPNTTVLLVEDTDYNALAATAVLRRLGLTCERARTGAEALELFTTRRFNLVLLDRNLPDMDGTEIAHTGKNV